MVIAAELAPDVAVPPAVRAVIAGRPARPVWQNELGGLTFEITAAAERCFVKWTPTTSSIDLNDEVIRLDWAGGFCSVPRVLDQGADDTGSWIVTSALTGENAVTQRWRAQPERAVAAIGWGLRALHDALPVPQCPFRWTAADRVEDARGLVAAGQMDPTAWHESHQRFSVEQALQFLTEIPPVDHLVVCHGDACAPNTVLREDGSCSGHVDLGSLGVADRWADLAIATWSTQWNYGPGWEDTLLAAYGVDPDCERTAYYRLLWDLV